MLLCCDSLRAPDTSISIWVIGPCRWDPTASGIWCLELGCPAVSRICNESSASVSHTSTSTKCSAYCASFPSHNGGLLKGSTVHHASQTQEKLPEGKHLRVQSAFVRPHVERQMQQHSFGGTDLLRLFRLAGCKGEQRRNGVEPAQACVACWQTIVPTTFTVIGYILAIIKTPFIQPCSNLMRRISHIPYITPPYKEF